jgi:hypothetical protein
MGWDGMGFRAVEDRSGNREVVRALQSTRDISRGTRTIDVVK